jgi:regulator of protease activity HflC (stomatin/prohibitin superfamily)
MLEICFFPILIGFVILFFMGIRIVRPIERGLVERFGKLTGVRESGLHFIIPFIERMVYVNITEQMMDIQPQTVITKDKLNAIVDAVVYYKIHDPVKATYNVDDHRIQLVSLARTTLRAVIGKMTLTEANENRDEINKQIEHILDKETNSYGVEVLRVELQKIEPPMDVQDSMNKVVKAEQEKIAAMDLASAAEIKADGERRAEIKKAEGVRQAYILEAQGEAQAKVALANAEAEKIKIENEALQKHFVGSAQTYKALQTYENAFKKGTKYVIDSKSNIVNVMSEMTGTTLVPLNEEQTKTKKKH